MQTMEHNYLKKMHAMHASGALPREYGVHMIAVYHDAWCLIYADGYCNCDPDIALSWSLPAHTDN